MQDIKFNPKSEIVLQLPNIKDAKELTFYYIKNKDNTYKVRVLINGKWHKPVISGSDFYFEKGV